MSRPFRLVALTALLLVAAVPSVAHGKAKVGISENKPQMFNDVRFKDLKIKDVRVVVGWDVVGSKTKAGKAEQQRLDLWMDGAKRDKARVLIAFDKSKNKTKTPTTKKLVAALKKLRKRYPGQIKRVSPWNEGNLNKKPSQYADWYKGIKKVCKGCKVVPDVVDKPNLVTWTKSFRRAIGSSKIKIWGLHNYVDVNNSQTKRTKAFLKATTGEVWLTETGGVVYRSNGQSKFAGKGVDFAGKQTTFLFDKIVKPNKRIKLVYVYHWNIDQPQKQLTWDSALIDNLGNIRPAYFVIKQNI